MLPRRSPPAEAARRSKRLPWHARSGLDLAEVVAETPGFWQEGRREGSGTNDGVPGAMVLGVEVVLLSQPARRRLEATKGVHPTGIVRLCPGHTVRARYGSETGSHIGHIRLLSVHRTHWERGVPLEARPAV